MDQPTSLPGAGKDYYAVLGVPVGAAEPELRAAHRRLVKQWHPDVWVPRGPAFAESAHRELCEVNEAYAVLGDRARRVAYDARRADASGVPSNVVRLPQQRAGSVATTPSWREGTARVDLAQQLVRRCLDGDQAQRADGALVGRVVGPEVGPQARRSTGTSRPDLRVELRVVHERAPREPMRESTRTTIDFVITALLVALAVLVLVSALELVLR